MNGTGDAKIYAAENRTQRNTRFLVDVKYVVQVEAIIRNIQCERDIELGINVFEKQKAEILNRFKNRFIEDSRFLECLNIMIQKLHGYQILKKQRKKIFLMRLNVVLRIMVGCYI